MGVYYLLVNHETKEKLDPALVGSGNIKRSGIIFGAVAHLFTFLFMRDPNWTILGDGNLTYTECDTHYRDVTELTVRDYNRESFGPEDHIEYNVDVTRGAR